VAAPPRCCSRRLHNGAGSRRHEKEGALPARLTYSLVSYAVGAHKVRPFSRYLYMEAIGAPTRAVPENRHGGHARTGTRAAMLTTS